MSKCTVCGKEFVAKHKDAMYCSGACKVKSHRGVTETKPIVTEKDSRLCKEKGCNLRAPFGNEGRCIYHWKMYLNMPTIPEKDYIELNKAQETDALVISGM